MFYATEQIEGTNATDRSIPGQMRARAIMRVLNMSECVCSAFA